MSELSFTQKTQLADAFFITLIYTQGSDGKRYYAYMAIKALDLPKFKEVEALGSFKLEDYGVILAAGEGEPTDAVKRYMKEEYGVEPFEPSGGSDAQG